GLYDSAETDHAVVFLHGFERTTVERKFKTLADALNGRVHLLRFDFAGSGLSDGDYGTMTVAKMTRDVASAIDWLRSEAPTIKHLSLVGHSLGACVALSYAAAHPEMVNRLVLLAPALNQRVLQRYWFVRMQNREARFENYEASFDEQAFQKFMQEETHKTKETILGKGYFLENAEADYRPLVSLYPDPSKILVIQGTRDDKVPTQTNDGLPSGIASMTVQGGDHDLQSPDALPQYLNKIVSFLA
ncbi:MAG: alpha/beta hydrolase, partial [bacterium]|nr:alpha/beta hydrolase [bacterium]